jgi:hypothetical protein
MTDAERRRWAQAYLKCDPDTSEPAHQEMVTVDDLMRAMEAEAAYRVPDVAEAIEVVSYPGDRGCSGGYRLEIRIQGSP